MKIGGGGLYGLLGLNSDFGILARDGLLGLHRT